jgi:hypothetical protein
MLAEKLERHRDREEQNKLSVKVLVMQPILRFLQLLCENHNRYLQVCIIMLKVFFFCSFSRIFIFNIIGNGIYFNDFSKQTL